MKKLGIILVTFIGLVLSSCNFNPVSKSYYVEEGLVTKTYAQTLINQYSSKELSASEVLYLRNQLRSNAKHDSIDSYVGVTEDEMYNVLVNSGCSPSESKTLINQLKNVGNIIVFFNYKYDETLVIYTYVAREDLNVTAKQP